MASVRRRIAPLVTAKSTLEFFAHFAYGTRSMYASCTSLLRSAQKYQKSSQRISALVATCYRESRQRIKTSGY
jgi:hypothetical protein